MLKPDVSGINIGENVLGARRSRGWRLGETIDHSYIKAEEVLPDEDIAEAEVVLKGKCRKGRFRRKPEEEKTEESVGVGTGDKEDKRE